MRRHPLRRARVFVDTSAYYAISDRRDTNHDPAVALARLLADRKWPLITTNFILAETHALVLRKLGRAVAYRVLVSLNGSATTRVRVTEADEARALTIIAQYTDKEFSFTDATSFAVMERLAISYAFTFDGDFEQYGFPRTTPDLLR